MSARKMVNNPNEVFIMKWNKLVKEATNDFKKLLVANGVRKFPSGTKFGDTKGQWLHRDLLERVR